MCEMAQKKIQHCVLLTESVFDAYKSQIRNWRTLQDVIRLVHTLRPIQITEKKGIVLINDRFRQSILFLACNGVISDLNQRQFFSPKYLRMVRFMFLTLIENFMMINRQIPKLLLLKVHMGIAMFVGN